MNRNYQAITIRNATLKDAPQLCLWWNDGAVMAHAGFPLGLNTTAETIAEKIAAETDDTTRRHMLLYENKAIGEMNYRNLGNGVCEIGIKICDAQMQNKGLGKIALSLFIEGLFSDLGYTKIMLDTNLENKRAQHVYEQLGFRKLRINHHSWVDQLGVPQSSVDYELIRRDFKTYL